MDVAEGWWRACAHSRAGELSWEMGNQGGTNGKAVLGDECIGCVTFLAAARNCTRRMRMGAARSDRQGEGRGKGAGRDGG